MLELSVLQLNNYLKNLIDQDEFLFYIGVFGEVSNYKISGGNAYFDIIEEGAQLSCIQFGAGADIKNGDRVLVSGRVNYHTRFGKLTFIASKIEPFGLGALYKKYLELKAKLEAEGLFDERYKKQLPKFASCIGVVTSETGAVIHDIIRVTRKNNPYTDIVLYPAKVQGEGAEFEIAQGIKYLDSLKKIDLIIVARGGGSFEDLGAFNTEAVARAVFECKKPIVSGVGHETDFSLCDFAADVRASTPSVAAEISVFKYFDAVNDVSLNLSNIKSKINELLRNDKAYVANNLDNISHFASRKVDAAKNRVLSVTAASKSAVTVIVANAKSQLELVSLKIDKTNPMNLLKRGYTKVLAGDKLVKSVDDVSVGDEIKFELSDGKVYAKVLKGEKR